MGLVLEKGCSRPGFLVKGVGFVISDAKIVCSDWWCLVVFAVVQCL